MVNLLAEDIKTKRGLRRLWVVSSVIWVLVGYLIGLLIWDSLSRHEEPIVVSLVLAGPLIILFLFKAVKWVYGGFTDEPDEIKSSSSEEDKRDSDLSDKPLLAARPNLDESDVTYDLSLNEATDLNVNANKTSVWAAPLRVTVMVFLQLCFFASLAFLFSITATTESLEISSIVIPRLIFVPFFLVCIYPSIWLNKIFITNNPKCQPFAWGYYNSFLIVTISISGSVFGAWIYSDEGGSLIIWCFLLIALGTLLYRRNRWAWVIFTILSANPASWVINGVYLKNRWQEMKI